MDARHKPRPSGMARTRTYCVLGALAVLFVTDPLVQTLQGVYSTLVKDQYALYRARLEQAQLREANSRMTSELVSLRSNNSRANRIEQQVADKLVVLEQTIEQATQLGILSSKKGSRGQVLARTDTQNQAAGKSGALAAILDSPELTRQDPVKGSRARSAGVGGSEVPCDDDECEFGATKKNIGLGSVVVAPELTDPAPLVASDLERRINRAVAAMRVLPIGSPVDGEISSGFGKRHSPFSHRTSFHHGIDLSLKIGSKVMATGEGVVTRVAYNRTYGKLVDIEHIPGLVTRYAHLTEARVRAGQRVRRGQVIALSGSTGRSTGPHLHYEVIHKGRARNPLPFIQLAQKLESFAPFLNVG